MKLVKMFQFLGLGTIWSQNIASILSLSCGKICAAAICCIPLSHNISYNILISFNFLIVIKSDFFSLLYFRKMNSNFKNGLLC